MHKDAIFQSVLIACAKYYEHVWWNYSHHTLRVFFWDTLKCNKSSKISKKCLFVDGTIVLVCVRMYLVYSVVKLILQSYWTAMNSEMGDGDFVDKTYDVS